MQFLFSSPPEQHSQTTFNTQPDLSVVIFAAQQYHDDKQDAQDQQSTETAKQLQAPINRHLHTSPDIAQSELRPCVEQ